MKTLQIKSVLSLVALSITPLVCAPKLRATTEDEIRELRAEVRALEQKIDALEAKDQGQPAPVAQAPAPAQEATPAVPASPVIKIDDTGFSFASHDGQDFIRLHGLVQLDSHWFFDDKPIANNDGFLIRRARLIFEGGFNRIYSFNLVPEFGGGAAGTSNAPVIYDANLGIALAPSLKFTLGKFKSPIGQEMLQNDAALLFTERSLATNLVPSRDIGVMAGGDLVGGHFNYTVAVLDGGADGTYSSNVPLDNNKDFVARLITRPFVTDTGSPLSGLSVGIAGSRGSHNPSAGLTSGYKSDGQQTIFTYITGVAPYGPTWRLAPQATYYVGPLGIAAEYTRSAVSVLSGKSQAELTNSAWQVSTGFVLTGEHAAYEGVKPANPFNPSTGAWGAWELAARVAQLKLDSAAFPLFANPAASASADHAYATGLNWYLSNTVRAMFDFEVNRFDHPFGTTTFTNAVIAQPEKAFLTRFQVGF